MPMAHGLFAELYVECAKGLQGINGFIEIPSLVGVDSKRNVWSDRFGYSLYSYHILFCILSQFYFDYANASLNKICGSLSHLFRRIDPYRKISFKLFFFT